jgi:hypothetical protein
LLRSWFLLYDWFNPADAPLSHRCHPLSGFAAAYTGDVQSGQMLSPDEFWQRQSTLDGEVQESFLHRTAYGIVDWSGTAMLGEWSLGDGTYRSLRFDDGPGVTVVVASADRAAEAALDHLLMNLPVSLELRLDTSAAPPEHRQPTPAGAVAISVSDIVTIFEGWNSAGFTVAGAAIGQVDLAVCWRGIDARLLRLAPVDAIEPFLEGRREFIRTARRRHGFDE